MPHVEQALPRHCVMQPMPSGCRDNEDMIMTTTAETEKIALARSLFDAFALGNLAAREDKLAANFTFSYPGLPDGRGIAAARAYNQPFADAFSDWKTEVEQSAISGNTVFLLIKVHATMTGPLASKDGVLPPSGRRGVVPAVVVAEIENGKIRHEATYWNVPDLVVQLMPLAA